MGGRAERSLTVAAQYRQRQSRDRSEEKVKGFLPVLENMIGSGLVTLERVQVLQYGPGAAG